MAVVTTLMASPLSKWLLGTRLVEDRALDVGPSPV
jgi:hypothetical protein